MTTFNIDHKDLSAITEWCVANIGPLRYYLHDQLGGTDWHIFTFYKLRKCQVSLKDEKKALFALLKFSKEVNSVS